MDNKDIFSILAQSKPMKVILNYAKKKPENFARVLILANVAKDAINCGFYTYQSLNNNNIPEEKRKFVAALDLSNGALMVAAQLLLGYGFTSKTVQEAITNKLFGKIREEYKKFIKPIQAEIKDPDVIAKIVRNIEHEKVFSKCKAGFKAISTMIVTAVIAKRVIVPFIATPLAGWFKNKYMEAPTLPKQPVAPVYSLPEHPVVKQNFNHINQNFNNFVQKGVMFHY